MKQRKTYIASGTSYSHGRKETVQEGLFANSKKFSLFGTGDKTYRSSDYFPREIDELRRRHGYS